MSNGDRKLRAEIVLNVENTDVLRLTALIKKVPTIAGTLQAMRDGVRENLHATLAEGHGTWNTVTGEVKLEVGGATWRGHARSVQALHTEIMDALGL